MIVNNCVKAKCPVNEGLMNIKQRLDLLFEFNIVTLFIKSQIGKVMKKNLTRLLITGVISLALVISSSAQVANSGNSGNTKAKKDFRFTVKTNPLSALGGPFWILFVPITGEYKILGEAAIAKKVSLQVGASYVGPSVLVNLNKLRTDTATGFQGINVSGFKVSGMLKYFLSRDLNAPQGFYIGPHISYASAKIKSKEISTDYVNGTKLNINAVVGYQLITSGGFCLDIFTGMGFVKRTWSFKGNSQGQLDLTNKATVSIPLGVSFGYAF
jgi:hypothetical protein